MALTIRTLWKGIAYTIPFCVLIESSLLAQSEILWENSMAIGVTFNLSQSNDQVQEVDQEPIIIITLQARETSILGRIEKKQNSYSFFPVVPFTSGLSYQIKIEGEVINKFSVPYPENIKRSTVTNIFPSSETIPANLLKIHIYFSQPMEEGRAMDFVNVLGEKGDTVKNIFLDLQPELWNEDRMGLTIWLDPGRIKRDLQPNLKMGLPLKVNSKYQIAISKSWKDKYGLELLDDFTRAYIVVNEDREKPAVELWEITYPNPKTRDAFIVDFKKTIDYEVAISSIYLYKDDQLIDGNIILANKESVWKFNPTNEWSKGKYELVIESRIEDLAGNNLNRLFDQDLEIVTTATSDRHQVEISFELPQNSMP